MVREQCLHRSFASGILSMILKYNSRRDNMAVGVRGVAPILAVMATLATSVHGDSDRIAFTLRHRAEPDVLVDVRPHPTSKTSRLECPPTAAFARKLSMQVKRLNESDGHALRPEHYHLAIGRIHEDYLVRRHWH